MGLSVNRKEAARMKMQEIKEKARALGIKKLIVKKDELIREIQRREGNFPCFGTAGNYCDQLQCCFRGDCLKGEGKA